MADDCMDNFRGLFGDALAGRNAEEIVDHFRSRRKPALAEPGFLLNATVKAVRAEDVLDGSFFEPLLDGEQIKWERTGMTEVGWWYNRHYFLPALVRGDAALTGEKVRAGWRLWRDWHRQAAPPQKLSEAFCDLVAWRELEVARRLQCMLYFFERVRSHPQTTDDDIKTMLASVVDHGRFLVRHLAKFGFFPGNHQEQHGPALFIAGVYLPELKEAEEFRRTGLEILSAHLEHDYYADGWQKETASGYQLLCVADFSDTIRNAEANDVKLPAGMVEFFPKMLGAAAGVLAGDGRTAAFNDANHFHEVGRIRRLAEWHRLEWGALCPQTSQLFPQAQIAVLRPGGGSSVFVDATRAASGHWHPGKPNFEWFAQGRWMIVDPGVVTYDGGDYLRWYKAAFVHNTMTVDGRQDVKFKNAWQYEWSAKPRIVNWQPPHSISIATDGYARLDAPVEWTRGFLCRGPDELRLADQIESPGEHSYVFHFHAAADMTIEEQDGLFVVSDDRDRGFTLRFKAEALKVRRAEICTSRIAWGDPPRHLPFSPEAAGRKIEIEMVGASGKVEWFLDPME